MVGDALMYSIATDGWSNITNEHLVNFILLIPRKNPFFYRSITTTASQTSEEIAKTIIDIVNEIGHKHRLCSVVTDNASNKRYDNSPFKSGGLDNNRD